MFNTLVHKILKLSYIGLAFLLVGCVSLATDLRKEGFDAMQKGFTSVKETPNLHKVITIKEVKIHIVGNRALFDWNVAAAYGSPVAAYANTKNEIWIIGKETKGKIIVNQAILGHEFKHLLNFSNPEIANPDLLDDLGV